MSELNNNLLALVTKMVPHYGQDDYEQIFESTVAHLNVGEQFTVGNEITRICQSCEKVIDLRKSVKAKCRKFIYAGRVHYMDELGIDAFNQGLEQFSGYTIGVFEAVNNAENNIAVQKLQAQQEHLNALKQEQQRKAQKLQHIMAAKLSYNETSYPVHLIRFGEYLNRQEERMNYSVSAQLTLADGSVVDAVTKDLSMLGIYLRIGQQHQVALDEQVTVTLSAQGSEYLSKIGSGIVYQIKRLEYADGVIWLGLSRSKDDTNLAWYDSYLENLIASNKYVYKVNLDNAIDAALKQGHEQVFFARTLSACVFVETLGGTKRIKYGLGSGRSVAMMEYFRDGRRCYLSSLLTSNVLSKLAQADVSHYLYCFTHKVENQLLYFAAFDWQFEDKAIERLFCAYGAKKESWRVFKVQALDFVAELKGEGLDMTQGLNNGVFVLPNQTEERDEAAPSIQSDGDNQTDHQINNLPDLSALKSAVIFTPVNALVDSQCYASQTYDANLMAGIKDFQLYYSSGTAEYSSDLGAKRSGIDWLYCGLEELRHESRYRYKTKILVSLDDGDGHTANHHRAIEGTSADFSARGLQLVVPTSLNVHEGQVLRLSFPLLQKITRTLKLSDLAYQVVRTDVEQKVIYLQAKIDTDLPHHGVRFFRDLIKQNAKKLPLLTESAARLNLVNGLKCLYQRFLVTAPCFINRVDGHNRLTKLVGGSRFVSGLSLLTERDEQGDFLSSTLNFASIYANESLADFIAHGAGLNTGADAKVDDDKMRSIDVFIGVKPVEQLEVLDDSAIDVSYTVTTSTELSSFQLQQQFVKQCLSEGQFYAMRLYLCPVERVEVRKLANELAYIHHYAQHKSVHIAKLLTRIAYVGEWVDIGDYVCRYLAVED